MSITVVSTLPKSVPSVSKESKDNTLDNDSSAAGLDFASLLLGQLVPNSSATYSEASAKTDKPVDDSTSSDATPGNAAAVIASLGLVAPNQRELVTDTTKKTDTSLPATSKIDKTASGALTTVQSTTTAVQGLKTEIASEPAKTLTTPPTTLDTEAQPAIFAAPTVEATNAGGEIAKEAASNSISALLGHAPAAPIPSPHRETATSVPPPIRDQNWAADFSQKVVWLATNDKQSAQITINPPQMGTIEISLSMDKGNATASFASANSEVRNAIEAALPRLREMFANAGISLGQTNVSAESFRQQSGGSDGQRNTSQRTPDNAILATDSAGSLPVRSFYSRQGNGLVNTFA